MRNLKHLLWVVFIVLMAVAGHAEKRGLVIAIGEYPKVGGWPTISSANDIPYVLESLKHLGFGASNIRLIQDEQATKSGIQNAFNQLTQQARQGDIIYFHFSGHGQQVMDDNGDEVDRLDEAIVPFDSHLKYRAGVNEGQFLIRDDELNNWLNQLRAKVGISGQIILVLDACHSGTGTRGTGAYRGTDILMAAPTFHLQPMARHQREQAFDKTLYEHPNYAPIASFFGASPNQLNFETVDYQGKAVGSLSYAMSQVLVNMKRCYTFQELYDRVSLKMKTLAPRQTPVWEGNKMTKILGGNEQNQVLIHNVLRVLDPQTVTVDIGNLHNVFEGTIVEILALNNQIQATGVVSRAGLSQSEIKINGFLVQHQDIQYRVRIKQLANPPIYSTLVSLIPPNSRWYNLSRELLKNNFIRLQTQNPELILSIQRGDDAIQLLTRTGEVLYNSKSNYIEKHQFQLQSILRRYTQAKYLKGYELRSANLELELELLQIPCAVKNTNQATPFPFYPPVVNVGDCVKLRITNKGRTTAYFSVLDIQPDHKINMLIPAIHLGYSASDYYLKPGESFITEFNIRIVEPMGNEALKLISSTQPIDLPAIMESRGMSTQTQQDTHPFAELMAMTYQPRGTNQKKVLQSVVDDLSVATYFFSIVP